MNRVDRKDLRALRDKYERMASLRRAEGHPDPRPELARLADEFPGALREIDLLPLDVIDARIASLAAVERHAKTHPAEPWMVAQVLFHRYARGALATKRWLAGRKSITPAVRLSFARSIRTLIWGDDAKLFAGALDAIANPPRGRLMDLVYHRVAIDLDVTVAEARALVLDASHYRARLRGDR